MADLRLEDLGQSRVEMKIRHRLNDGPEPGGCVLDRERGGASTEVSPLPIARAVIGKACQRRMLRVADHPERGELVAPPTGGPIDRFETGLRGVRVLQAVGEQQYLAAV